MQTIPQHKAAEGKEESCTIEFAVYVWCAHLNNESLMFASNVSVLKDAVGIISSRSDGAGKNDEDRQRHPKLDSVPEWTCTSKHIMPPNRWPICEYVYDNNEHRRIKVLVWSRMTNMRLKIVISALK
jgi:hypothetical protein